MKTLQHDQQIRIEGFEFNPVIRVFTLTGYAIANGQNPDEVLERAFNNNHNTRPCALQEASMLTADYAGKAEEMRQKAIAYQNAPMLSNGETVEIEGQKYTFRKGSQQCSDCGFFNHA